MPDRTIACVECGRAFVWSEAAQRFYAERRLSPPKRCHTCRERRKSGLPGMFRYGRLSWLTHPGLRFGLVGLGASALVAALILRQAATLSPWLVWLLAITPVTLLLFAYDKAASRLGGTRVPEVLLLGLAAVGGTLGALAGMWLVHHKTAKTGFLLRLWVIVGLQAVAIVALWLGGAFIGLPR